MLPLFDQREFPIRPIDSLSLRPILTGGQTNIFLDQNQFLIGPSVSLSMTSSGFDGWTDGYNRVFPAPDGTIYLVDTNETHYWGSK